MYLSEPKRRENVIDVAILMALIPLEAEAIVGNTTERKLGWY
jgi:hypothetical protein